MLSVADLVLVVLLALMAEAAVVGLLVRRVAVAAARPRLPEADRPPAGLGRLVPVGRQLEQDCAAGLLALERWLAAQRRHEERGAAGTGGGPRRRGGGADRP